MEDQRPQRGPVRLCKRPPGLGWDPLERADWEQISAALTSPWPAGAVRADLRYWASLERMGREQRPSVRQLAVRWGLSEKAARTMVADSVWWADQAWVVTVPKPLDAPETHSGRTPDALGTHSGRVEGAQSAAPDALRTHSGRTPDALGTHPPVRVGPLSLFSGRLTETETGTETETETPEDTLSVEKAAPSPPRPPLPPLPEWSAKVRVPEGVSRRELVGVVLRTIARVTRRPLAPEWCAGDPELSTADGRQIDPEAKTDASQVLGLWTGLGRPNLATFEKDAKMVAQAFHENTRPLFARNVRAQGWPEGTDRSRHVGTFCVLKAWEERLRVATDDYVPF